MYDLRGKRVWVAGHRGMAGAAIVRRLRREPCTVLTVGHDALDLRCGPDVDAWVREQRPDAVIVAAARVGGIQANLSLPADFIHDNLSIAVNVIGASHRADVGKLIFLGSSCIYPRDAAQPIREDALLTGPLEPSNEPYAVAKIAGVKLCQAYRRQHGADFVAIMPSNLYGPGDHYDPEHSHVPAALLRRFHEAKVRGCAQATVWGSGTPRREFLYVEDLADACVFVLERYSDERVLNVGSGHDITIAEFARKVARVVGFEGALEFDPSKPDGTPRKLLDTSRLAAMGWQATTGLDEGLASAYEDFLARTPGVTAHA